MTQFSSPVATAWQDGYHAAQSETATAIETRFWSVVDRDGLTGLPSDMWDALDVLVSRAKKVKRK